MDPLSSQSSSSSSMVVTRKRSHSDVVTRAMAELQQRNSSPPSLDPKRVSFSSDLLTDEYKQEAAFLGINCDFKDKKPKRIEMRLLEWVCMDEAKKTHRRMAAQALLQMIRERGMRLDLSNIPLSDNPLPEFVFAHEHLQMHMKECILDRTGITELPLSFAHLKSLKYLSWKFCGLTKYWENLGSLSSLETLDLSYNKLRDISSLFRQLPLLRALHLTGNPLTSKQLNSLFNHRTLTHLYLCNCNISFLPQAIRGNNLKHINLSCNYLHNLPKTFFSRLPQLQMLELSINPLTNLPEELYQMPSSLQVSLENINPAKNFLDLPRIQAPTYRGPRFLYTFAEVPKEAFSLSAEDYLKELYEKRGQPLPDFSPLLGSDLHFQNALRDWLARLPQIPDFQERGEVYQNYIFDKIIEHFAFALQNRDFASFLREWLLQATNTCIDLIAFSVLHLGIYREICEMREQNPLPPTLLPVMRRQIAIHVLATVSDFYIRREEKRSGKESDRVGIQFFLTLETAKALQLGFDIEGMEFGNKVLKIPPDAIADVISQVETALTATHFAPRLLQEEVWLKALQRAHPQEYEIIEIERTCVEMTAANDEELEAGLIAHNSALLALTLPFCQ